MRYGTTTRTGRVLLILLAAAWLFACASAQEPPVIASSASPGEVDGRPRLVVLVVVDQLAAWVLQEHLPLLPADSVIRAAWESGSQTTVAFPYANTATAAGHTTLVTGVLPAEHGVLANEIWDPALGRRKIVDDGAHGVIGNPGRHASPTIVRAPGVADMLHEETDGRAIIIGLSHKARAAILSTGKSADLAVFWDEHTAAMTTSAWYRPSGTLPAWLEDFNRQRPLKEIFGPWESPPSGLPCERDDAPGEGPFLGWDNTLPHDPADSDEPGEAFAYTPRATIELFELARIAVSATGMGQDDIPDLLVLGVSGTDKIGHVWGPHSCEYVDNLLQTDRELSAFARSLGERFPVSFLLTADHGVSPLPERGPGDRGRISLAGVLEAARQAAADTLGPGEWIGGYTGSMLWFTAAGEEQREKLLPVVRDKLLGLDGIHRVYDVSQARDLRHSQDELDRLAGASLPETTDADLLLIPKHGWFNELPDVPGGGTSHGTPWEYDREVPVLIWGAGASDSGAPELRDARQVATLLAKLLDVSPPPGAPALPGRYAATTPQTSATGAE